MVELVDLFSKLDDADQLSLFGAGEGRMQAPVRRYTPEPDDVRRRLQGLLGLVRESTAMPWSDRDARMWQTVFPQMANWLPEDEADQLRFEFAQEIERLKAA